MGSIGKSNSLIVAYQSVFISLQEEESQGIA